LRACRKPVEKMTVVVCRDVQRLVKTTYTANNFALSIHRFLTGVNQTSTAFQKFSTEKGGPYYYLLNKFFY
jgi:hypothetical protein